jgi:NAD(P)H dehydrogenase (quinone)
VVTTHGSAKWVNAVQGEGGKRVAFRSLRVLCSRRCRTTWLALYGADTGSVDRRTAFLDRVERRMRSMR